MCPVHFPQFLINGLGGFLGPSWVRGADACRCESGRPGAGSAAPHYLPDCHLPHMPQGARAFLPSPATRPLLPQRHGATSGLSSSRWRRSPSPPKVGASAAGTGREGHT
jgi:hypothetical protein